MKSNEKGTTTQGAVSLGVPGSMGSHGPGIRSLIVPRTSEVDGQRDQSEAMPLAEIPRRSRERENA